MNRYLFSTGAILAITATAALLASQSARADSIKITDPAGFTSPVTVNSDAGSIVIDNFVITNTTTTNTKSSPAADHTLEIQSLTPTIGGTHTGNPDDLVTSIAVSGGTCSIDEILAEGGSCTVDLTLDFAGAAPSKATGKSSDLFGTSVLRLKVDTTNLTNGNTPSDSLTFDATVNYSDAPEPGSLVLLGTGILGLAGIVRRRRTRG